MGRIWVGDGLGMGWGWVGVGFEFGWVKNTGPDNLGGRMGGWVVGWVESNYSAHSGPTHRFFTQVRVWQ